MISGRSTFSRSLVLKYLVFKADNSDAPWFYFGLKHDGYHSIILSIIDRTYRDRIQGRLYAEQIAADLSPEIQEYIRGLYERIRRNNNQFIDLPISDENLEILALFFTRT
ncbi:MAG TPA: hypothetical protein VMR37_03075 [Rhabdochlamydiaceae bacterium]|nr:hypothetical protein [Rhabdochlamydiaceae bacterium]